MKTYRIEYIETLGGHFYIQANSEAEALEKFDAEVSEGLIDLNQLEVISSSSTTDEVKDHGDG